MTQPPISRRPLASRETAWARAAARRLSAGRITPNQISQAAIGFAALGALGLVASAPLGGLYQAACLILAALCCQLRLVCNLLDGMVAVEGGKSAPDGPFWNEAPDRIADILLLAGAGIAAGLPALGWAAAAFAVLTAYLRELGRAEGHGGDFSGPMAKPQRMAVLTGAAVVAAFEPFGLSAPSILGAALWLVAIGAAATAARRSARLTAALRARR